MPDVAALNVVISADTRDLEAGLARAEQSVSKAGSAIQSAMGGALIAGVAGLGAALAGSVTSAAGFEKQISGIVAVSGEGAESIDRIRSAALQLGKDTSFSAGEAAAGMEEMIKAGLSVEQVLGGAAKATLDLAAASGTGVTESATVMSNALNTFKADNMAAADAASILAGAANASATSVHELSYGLSSAGNVAAALGMSFQDTTSLLALFAQNGLKGSDAGTSLKTMMLNLQPTTKAQVAEFERLGIATVKDGEAFAALKSALIASAEGQKAYDKMMKEGTLTTENMWKASDKLGLAAVSGTTSFERWLSVSGNLSNSFFDAAGNVKDAAGMSEVLNKALAGMTKEQRAASLEIMFGTDAIRAGIIMSNGGAEAVETMTEAMKKQGDIQKLAAERLNNVMGSLEKLKGSLETGAIVLGSMFLPALKGALDGLTDFANKGIDAIEMLPAVWGDVAAAFTGGPMDDALDTLLTSVLGFSGETAQAFEDLIRGAGEMWTGIQPILTGIATAIQENVAPIAAFAAGFLGAIGTVGLFSAAIAAVTVVLTLLLSPIGLVAIAVGLLAAAWTTNFMGIQEATAAAWAYLLPIFTQIVDWLGPKISAVLTWLTTTGWPMMLAAAQTVGNWITTVAIPAITELITWLGPKISAVLTWLTTVGWPALVTAALKISDWITTVAVPAFTTLVQWIGEKLSAVVTWMYTTGWPTLVTAGEKVWAVVQEIQRFFALLYIELDKREVFATLAKLWDTLTAAGLLVWDIIKKMDAAFRPFQTLTAEFNAGPGKVLVATFGLMGTSGTEAGKGIDVVKVAAEAMGKVFEIALFPLKNFLQNLKDLGELIEKAKNWTLPSFNLTGGGTSGGGVKTLSYLSTQKGPIDNSSREAFLKTAYPYALEAAMGDAKFAQQLLATALNENGRIGTGDARPFGFNFGGIQGVTGTAPNVTALDAGNPRSFAQYNTPEEGFGAVANLMSSGRYAAAYEKYKKSGDIDQFWADAGMAGYAEDPAWAQKVGNIRRNQVEPVTVNIPKSGGSGLGDIKISQTQWGASVGMTPAEAAAACGPYAAAIFAQATGRMPNAAEAEKLARAAGWTEAGMGGTGNFMKLLGDMGVNAVRTGTAGMSAADITTAAANAGPLTAFSTPKHYFASTGFNPADQTFNVGATGTALAGGKEHMTVAEMAALGGGIQDIITLAGQMGTAFNDASATTLHASGAMATGVTTNATTLATTVPQQFNMMAAGVLASVSTVGTSIQTSLSDAAGNAVVTVTAANGEILNQYVNMANGVTFSLQDAAVKSTASVNTMTGEITRIVTDGMGNVVTTVTSSSGQVVSQFVTVGTEAVKQVAPVETLYNAVADVPTINMTQVVAEWRKAQKAAESYLSILEDIDKYDVEDGKKVPRVKTPSSNTRAAGGPVSANQMYLVGEQGPEMFLSRTNGTIIPNDRLSSGGPVTVVNVSVGGSLVAQSELEDTIARAVATSLRGGSLAWSN